MLKEQTGNLAELPRQAARTHLEHEYCEAAREVYQTIHQSGLDKFTFPLIDLLYNDLYAVVSGLERLPEETFKEWIEVIVRLREARNELRLARFLFSLEEINSIRRLVMRNKAILRGKHILHAALSVWLLYNSSHE